MNPRRLSPLVASCALTTVLALVVPGCDPGQQNDREFLSSTKPGTPPADPNESYASKRGRLKTSADAAAEKAKTEQKSSAKGGRRRPGR